jgi:hypothetical protein
MACAAGLGFVGLRRLPYAVVGALVAASPWFVFNVRNGWASVDPKYADAHGSYLGHLWALVTRGLPMVIGAREVYTERWLWWRLGAALAVAMVVAVVCAAAVGDVAARRHRGALLVTLLAGFTALYALFPNSSYVGPGRYQLYIAPVLCWCLATVVRPYWWVAAGSVALAMLVTLGGLQAHYDDTQPFVAGGVPVPRDAGDLVTALEQLGRPAVYTDYWVAGPIRFLSGGRIDAASLNYYRDVPMQQRVDAAPRTVWVFVIGAHDESRLDCALDRLGIAARRVIASGYEIVVPQRTVRPPDIPVECG